MHFIAKTVHSPRICSGDSRGAPHATIIVVMQNMITMVMVSDMDRSVRFYRDTLGLKLRFQSPDWTEFDINSSTLALHGGGVPSPPDKERYAGRASIGFNVENVDKVFEELKSKGVRVVMPPTQRPAESIRLAVVLDPDGLPLSFSQTVSH
jgi:lactoylglutathione lyase